MSNAVTSNPVSPEFQSLPTAPSWPLSEIAISAGFANQSHFTRVFSAEVGVSPGAWRREVKGGARSEI